MSDLITSSPAVAWSATMAMPITSAGSFVAGSLQTVYHEQAVATTVFLRPARPDSPKTPMTDNSQRLDRMDTRFDRVEDRLGAIEGRVGTLETQGATIVERLKHMPTTVQMYKAIGGIMLLVSGAMTAVLLYAGHSYLDDTVTSAIIEAMKAAAPAKP